MLPAPSRVLVPTLAMLIGVAALKAVSSKLRSNSARSSLPSMGESLDRTTWCSQTCLTPNT
jgi:hypothetical protein